MEKINRVSPSLAALGATRSCVPVRVLTSLTSCSLCLSFATLALARIWILEYQLMNPSELIG